MKIEIKSWITGGAIFSIEADSWKIAVEAAVKQNADLSCADLRGADLRGADLSDAVLSCADLSCADLRDAVLSCAGLRGAVLSERQMQMFRDDVWAVLASAPAEVAALLSALKEGRVDGSQYQGDCACLVGTIAIARGCHYEMIDGLIPDSGRPSEQWFMQIKKGDTPETNPASKKAVEWIEQWLARMQAAFAVKA